jgi:hypothetical protein
VIFLGLLVLLWWWAGCRIDDHIQRRTGTYSPSRRVVRVELILVAGVSLYSLVFSCLYIVQATSPQSQHVGLFGLIWPAALLTYICSQCDANCSNNAGVAGASRVMK